MGGVQVGGAYLYIITVPISVLLSCLTFIRLILIILLALLV